jgi:predicted Zn-dependent protease
LLPPAVFLLGAGATRQCARTWDGYFYSKWRTSYQAAFEAGMQGDRVKALDQMTEAAKQAPADPDVHRQLAAGFQMLGRSELAVDSLERYFRLMEPQPNIEEKMWDSLVKTYCLMKRYDDAERILREKILPRWPNSSNAWLREGEIYLNREGGNQNLTRALECLEKSLSVDPKSSEARYQYGVCLTRLGRPGEAERAFKTVLEADPDHPTAQHDLAGVLRQQGKRDEAQRAVAIFQKIKERDARITHLRTQVSFEKIQPKEMLELGCLYLEAKQPGEAMPILVRYTKKEPADPQGHRKLGEAYRGLKRLEDAQAAEKLAAAVEGRRGGAG